MLRRLLRALWSLLAAVGLLFVAVSFSPLVRWWSRALAGPWTDPRGDVLIVLGGDALNESMIGVTSYWRAVYAVLVYRERGFREVLVSGAGVAPLIRDFLVAEGVPAGVIRLEASSSSTRENALNARQLLAGTPGRKVLLTSDLHMFRARRAFEKAGLEVVPQPFPDGIKRSMRWRQRWPVFLDLLEETAKAGYYWLRGWI